MPLFLLAFSPLWLTVEQWTGLARWVELEKVGAALAHVAFISADGVRVCSSTLPTRADEAPAMCVLR